MFDGRGVVSALPWIVIVVLAVLAATFLAARVTGKHSVIDTAWGLLFLSVALTVFVTSSGSGDDARRALLLALPAVWGLRLAFYIGRRSVGRPEDPRYVRLLAKAKGSPTWYALRVVYGLQGLLALLISAPLVVGAYERDPVRLPAWIGVAVWLFGLVFESVGDAQLHRFRSGPANRGAVMQSGLWRYTRHPNYFGDACVWWGIFLVAADRWPGVLTAFSPVLMTLLLTRGSGARIMDRHMAGRPGWAEYAARTSGFLPRPPRRPVSGCDQ